MTSAAGAVKDFIVAPLAGAWIEILSTGFVRTIESSLPSRERGLKSHKLPQSFQVDSVAPLAGAWIEITCADTKLVHSDCRSPRGSVD